MAALRRVHATPAALRRAPRSQSAITNLFITTLLRGREGGEMAADILALKHVSRIFGHCNNPALPFCLVCGYGISSCSVLKYWLENEKQEVLGCCNVREFYWHALERRYLDGWRFQREAIERVSEWVTCSECALQIGTEWWRTTAAQIARQIGR